MATKSKATAPAAAPVVAPAALSFADESVPESTRAPKANPFTEVVAALAANKGSAAKSVILPGDAVDANVRLMQAAGKDNGVTIRNRKEDAGNGSVKVTFWAVERITRPRGNKDK